MMCAQMPGVPGTQRIGLELIDANQKLSQCRRKQSIPHGTNTNIKEKGIRDEGSLGGSRLSADAKV